MKTAILNISEDIRKAIQKANIEMEAKRGLCAFMITSGTDLNDENYKKYEDSYMEAFKQFEQLKTQFEKDVVKAQFPTAVNWNLDYADDTVTIYYND